MAEFVGRCHHCGAALQELGTSGVFAQCPACARGDCCCRCSALERGQAVREVQRAWREGVPPEIRLANEQRGIFGFVEEEPAG